MRIYISGPITGHDDYMTQFAAAEKELEAVGYTVINPAKEIANIPGIQEFSYEQIMTVCIGMLAACDIIYMLRGWQESRGANREYGFALGKGKIIMWEPAMQTYRITRNDDPNIDIGQMDI